MGLFPTSLTPHLSRRTLLTVSIALNFLAGLAFVFVRGPYNIPVFNPNNTMSLTEAAVRYGARVHEASKRIQASMLIVGSNRIVATSGEYREVSILLINSLDQPVTYYGYRMDSYSSRPQYGEISPWVDVELRASADAPWKELKGGHCGYGAGTLLIPPKRAGHFFVHVWQPAESVRVGLDLTLETDVVPLHFKVWSEPQEIASP